MVRLQRPFQRQHANPLIQTSSDPHSSRREFPRHLAKSDPTSPRSAPSPALGPRQNRLFREFLYMISMQVVHF